MSHPLEEEEEFSHANALSLYLKLKISFSWFYTPSLSLRLRMEYILFYILCRLIRVWAYSFVIRKSFWNILKKILKSHFQFLKPKDKNEFDFLWLCENPAKVFLWNTCENPYDSHRIIVFLSDSDPDPDPSNSIIPILILLVMMLSIIVVYELVAISVITHEMEVLIDTVRGSDWAKKKKDEITMTTLFCCICIYIKEIQSIFYHFSYFWRTSSFFIWMTKSRHMIVCRN